MKLIVPFHKDFSPSGEQPEQHEQYFTNIAAIQNMGVLKQIWLYEIYGGILLICQNTTMRVNGAWTKRYCGLCSKTYNTLYSTHNFPIGSQQAAGAPASVKRV